MVDTAPPSCVTLWLVNELQCGLDGGWRGYVMTATKSNMRSRRESVTPFNAHADIYLPFGKVDFGSGRWLLIANQ